ncbi:helix-turn-helix domain-containing protein [Draconibacterium orientale]|uniref:helix-turn-helix domain-containing protein n=1 Tax=Draconibacterium orientale TaxID=1168034 RepID=UPI002A0A6224|nr:helix-turn-helix domain-containing protein [Draconibacterium orientale]
MSKKNIPEHQLTRIEEISLFIKNWRLNEGLTQKEFSELANVHVNSIYNLENQNYSNTPNLITLLNCIDATGLTLSQFFEGMN